MSMREGWKPFLMGDVADITDYVANGSFASLRENVSYKSVKDYAVLVRLADYSNNFDESKFVYIDRHSYEFLAKSKLLGGEIIMSNVGSVGKLFICPDLGLPMSLAPNSIVIKTDYNRFYYYLLSSSHYQHLIEGITSTTALPKFNKTSFKKIPISIPPLAEQERIVAELDLLSGIIDKQKAQLKELDTLAQSIFYDMFGNPVENEKGWTLKRLDEVGKVITGSTPSTKNEDNYSSNDYCFIKPSDIDKDVVSMISSSEYYISSKAYGKSRQLPKGSVLTTCIGIIGKVGILTIDATCNQQINAIIPFSTVSPIYLAYCILYNRGKLETIANAPVVPIINKGDFSSVNLPIPPEHLQQSFAERIAAIESQKISINQSIAESQKLFDYTMDKYFS